jgi:hypothetical protein
MDRIPDNVYRHNPENRSTDRNVHLIVLRVPVGPAVARRQDRPAFPQSRMAKKLKLQQGRAVIPNPRGLAGHLLLPF